MSLDSNLDWLSRHISIHECMSASILDIGSKNWDKTWRGWLTLHGAKVTGIDITPGPEVDIVCDVCSLSERFEPESCNIVTCIEMLEHVSDWKTAVKNMKQVLKPGGLLFLTTRMPDYPKHGYPEDYWRFTGSVLRKAFADFTIENLDEDLINDGVYMRARKPRPVDYDWVNAFTVL